MKNKFYKKILPTLFIALVVINSVFFVEPKKVEAQAVVQDLGNLVMNVVNTITTIGSNFIEYSNQYKEYVLDPLVSGAAKFMIKKITASVVNWINSGFQGSPAFVTDPGAFFLDVADQATAQFIAKSGPLSALCTNFNLDLRLALAFKYRPSIEQRYTCTLGTIIRNGRNAVENASINGFTAGDFQQGGWPAFVSLTTEPQNNVYGSYIQADTELSLRVLSDQHRLNRELDQGQGFLSWKSCKQVPVDTNTMNNAEVIASHDALDPRLGDYYETAGGEKTVEKCTTETPGSVIAGSLETQLGSGIRKLELADEIGEIVDALFANVATQILQGGLAGVSRKDSTGSSYLGRVTADIKGDESVKVAQKEILNGVDKYIKDTTDYKKWKDESKAIVLDMKNVYDATRACYTTRIASSTPPLSASQVAFAQTKIQELEAYLSTNVAPVATPILTSAQEADAKLATLLDIKQKATDAQTYDEILGPSSQYGQMIQSRTLITTLDIKDAREEVKDVRRDVAPLKTDATARLAACTAFTITP
ncbi:MAG: hypothetical protein V4697_03480 [Patescibacteria group bacterium]